MNNIHTFYHADRAASLKEHQEIKLNSKGLSYFGNVYWSALNSKSIEQMNKAELREYYLERIKREDRLSLYTSKMQSIFAANTIEEAKVFANEITPRPNYPIPIIEIFADKFWSLDSSWLDYMIKDNSLNNYYNYWEGKITNNNPSEGIRRPPRLEVMIALPATTGKFVCFVEP